MHWSEAYVGLPWRDRGLTREGVACWGLIRMAYADRLGLTVPDYASEIVEAREGAAVAGVYAKATAAGPWVAVDTADVREFDIVVFRVGGLDAHAGVVTEPGRMLHITSGQESCIVDYTTGRWAPRLSGVYRHEAIANNKPLIFRPQRGGLAESMAEARSVSNRAELIEHLRKLLGLSDAELRDEMVKVELYQSARPDHRIGWDTTYAVLVEGMGIAGFTSGPLGAAP